MMQGAITFNLKNTTHYSTILSAEDFFQRKARKIKNNTAIEKIFQRHSSKNDKSQSVAPINFPPIP